MSEPSENSTAIHEAGHAVIARVCKQNCGMVTIAMNEEETGYAMIGDHWVTSTEWDRIERYRDIGTVVTGRILAVMAGAEAEVEFFGKCAGGDGDDRYWIACMLDSSDARPWKEERLRRACAALVKRHRASIQAVAEALLIQKTLSGPEIDLVMRKPEKPMQVLKT